MTTSQLPSVIDVTVDFTEIVLLVEYLRMHHKCLEDLCEPTFLQDFSQNTNNNYQRHIIKYMLDKYVKSECMINEHPNLLVTFTFKLREILIKDVNIEIPQREVTFSNHMQFRSDIIMICFLQHLLYLNLPNYLECKVTMAIMFIVVNKYDINVYSPYTKLNEITFLHVTLSYVSVYFDMLYNNFFNFSDITRAFPCFNLPPMIYAPMIITIFPILDDPPIAILMVISLILQEVYNPCKILNISLVELYKHIIDFYKTTIPEKMKLRLCIRYNIVVLEGDKFKFAPCFSEYRQLAKDIISERKSNDPDLKDILSII